jgi:hypothetical protein
VARAEPGGAGEVLREGAAGAPAAHADVPTLERQGQLQIRAEEEETQAGQERRSRYVKGLTIASWPNFRPFKLQGLVKNVRVNVKHQRHGYFAKCRLSVFFVS